ncbi:MAG: LD-carboxypeptidase [Gammaproteobacteria bacterium]|nr:LD-carboxypeptidase [Gammaproteobacteria bacterium]MBV9697639.1 LD-carboxypeptidase [Gammaproteobacteria bacterium]
MQHPPEPGLRAPFAPPAALARGDRVAVIAPASGFDRGSFYAGLALIAARYHAEFGPGLFERRRYLAGDDARRFAELQTALADPGIKALFCARGGYGATRLLPRLLETAPPGRKPLIGFSDITALHLWFARHGLISVHGPVLTQLGRLERGISERLFALLESPAPRPALSGTATYVGGRAEGRLLGGNLSVLTRVIGTPYMPELEGALLLLEDQGERPYRLDRMWTHLRLAGVFERVRGLVLGEFTHCEEAGADYSSGDVLRELALETGLPCAAGFPIGHGTHNEPVPLGVPAQLDADACTLTFLAGAVS